MHKMSSCTECCLLFSTFMPSLNRNINVREPFTFGEITVCVYFLFVSEPLQRSGSFTYVLEHENICRYGSVNWLNTKSNKHMFCPY